MSNIKLIGHPDFSDVINKRIKKVYKSGVYLAIHFENECLLLSFDRIANFDIVGRVFNLSQLSWDQQVELGLLTLEERDKLQNKFKLENKENLKQTIFDLIKEYEDTYKEKVNVLVN